MKKIFALLFAALSVAFFACGDEKTDNGNDWFLTPAASADGTTVELTCLTRFGDGVLEELGAGFACAELTAADRSANSSITRTSRSMAAACRPG